MQHLPIFILIAGSTLTSCKKEEKKCYLFEQEKMYVIRDQKAQVDLNDLCTIEDTIYTGTLIKRTLTKTGTESELSAFMTEMSLSYFNNLGKSIVYSSDSIGRLMHFDKLGGEVKKSPCK